MRTNALQLLNENFNSVAQEISFKEWVITEAENDPNHFSWLFNDGDIESRSDLTEEQEAEYLQFLAELED